MTQVAVAVALREGREETGLMDLEPWPDTDLRHVVVVPVPANDVERAHEHADLRFVLATRHPDAARPERRTAKLRWLSIEDALRLTDEENVRETLRRVSRLLTTTDQQPAIEDTGRRDASMASSTTLNETMSHCTGGVGSSAARPDAFDSWCGVHPV
jgi:hypothetical protein